MKKLGLLVMAAGAVFLVLSFAAPSLAGTTGTCPSGYYFVPQALLQAPGGGGTGATTTAQGGSTTTAIGTATSGGNTYSGCYSASQIESLGSHLTGAQWVQVQAADWGMMPTQFIEVDSNTYVWCQTGTPYINSTGPPEVAGCKNGSGGSIAVIGDATYIYELHGVYYDLAPWQASTTTAAKTTTTTSTTTDTTPPAPPSTVSGTQGPQGQPSAAVMAGPSPGPIFTFAVIGAALLGVGGFLTLRKGGR